MSILTIRDHKIMVKSGKLIAISLLILAFGLLSPRANAQVLYGSIVGTVTDPTGATIPRAAVKATNPQTGESRDVVSDEERRFTIGNVLPGIYELHVSAAGFRAVTTTNVSATINTVTRVDIQMQVGPQSQEVTVTGAASELQTDKTDTHVELGSHEIGKLPLPN